LWTKRYFQLLRHYLLQKIFSDDKTFSFIGIVVQDAGEVFGVAFKEQLPAFIFYRIEIEFNFCHFVFIAAVFLSTGD
jgi:hypothetical protein